MRATALGGGEGILNCGSSLMGDALVCFLIVPPGGCAVFILEYGAHLDLGFSLSGVPSFFATDPLYSNFSYAWKGFLNVDGDLCGLVAGLLLRVKDEALREMGIGWKLSSRTLTKLEGNSPTARLSRRSLPVHHEPSPAFKHSMRSPSMNPRSRLL